MRFSSSSERTIWHGPRSITAMVGCLLIGAISPLRGQQAEVDYPASPDGSWSVELLLREPNIVTPTALAVDGEGRIFVIECHTHFRPDDYQGPPADRILRLVDSDHDGNIDHVSTFFEGTSATMGLLAERSGSLLVATRGELFRLRDTDDDGVADQRTQLATLETKGNYPHNGLSGLAVDATGHILVGFGENLGETYTLTGADGGQVTGGGEGGNIFRLRPDGSHIERWATGFWNPFQLAVDEFGRVFAVDNDPDWRPPCRLLHVVRDGDYGYRFALGRRGTHPFTTWFGDRPDRLGMIAGTGEAPSGMVVYRGGGLAPADEGALLVTSWGLHTLERYRLIRQGASFSSQAEIRIKGDEDYRPVGIDIDPTGAIIVSDWVKRSYPLHGHGRVWRHRSVESSPRPATDDPWATLRDSNHRLRLEQTIDRLATTADSVETLKTWSLDTGLASWRRALILTGLHRAGELDESLIEAVITQGDSEDLCVLIAPFAADLGISLGALEAVYQASPLSTDGYDAEVEAEWIRWLASSADIPQLVSLLETADPFLRQALISSIARVATTSQQCEPQADQPESTRIALASVLARRDDPAARLAIPALLKDASPSVRWVTLRWITESGLTEFRELVQGELRRESLTPGHFEAVLATLEQLDGRSGAAFEGGQLSLLESIIKGRNDEPGSVVALALRHLGRAARRDRVEQVPPGLDLETLRFLLNHESTDVRLEAIRAMAGWHTGDEARQTLMVISTDEQQPESVRREALTSIQDINALMLLATGGSSLQDDAIRSLRGRELTEEQKDVLREATVPALASAARDRLLGEANDGRPLDKDTSAWLDWIQAGEVGDAERGERWFFHSNLARCAACHAVDGRGAAIGPELSVIGEMGRTRLVESLIDPSREMAPRYTPWLVETVDGAVKAGLLETERGELQYYVDSNGQSFTVDFDDVVSRVASPHSIMPDDLLGSLTRDEIADLLAYLESLK